MLHRTWMLALLAVGGCGSPINDTVMTPLGAGPQYGFRDNPPAESASPSGEYSIKVITSTRRGDGPGTYRLKRGDAVVWEKQFPYCLERVWINDEGTFGGYGYDAGADGFGASREGEDAYGKLVFAIIDKDGAVAATREFRRVQGGHYHASPSPVVRSSSAFDRQNRVLIEVEGSPPGQVVEGIWLFDLEAKSLTRVSLPYVKPPQVFATSLTRLEPLPGTNLMVSQWYEYVSPTKLGTSFLVFDDQLNAVWRESWPYDYSNPTDSDEVQDAIDSMWYSGSIVATGDQSFMLRRVDPPQLIEYEVSGGNVRERSRKAFDENLIPKPKKEYVDWSACPRKSLAVLATLDVFTQASLEEGSFELMGGPDGSLALLNYAEDSVSIVQLDQNGRLIKRTRVSSDVQADGGIFTACQMGGSRYCVAITDYKSESAKVLMIDTDTGAQSELAALPGKYVDRVSSTDGLIAILGRIPSRYSQADFLMVTDSTGKKLWEKVQDGYRGDPGELFSPEDVEMKGVEVFVLNNISHEVNVYGARSGMFLRGYELESLWGVEPSYMTELGLVGDGFVLDGYSYKDQLVVTGPDFKKRATFSPRFPDGKAVEIRVGPHISEDRSIWVIGADAIHRLNSDGTIVASIGRQKSDAGLTEIFESKSNGADRVYASDAATGSVFAFDANLKPVAEFKVSREDFVDYPARARFEVSNADHVFIDCFDKDAFIEFDPQGRRLGERPQAPVNDFEGPEHFIARDRGENTRWCGEMLVDCDGKILANIGRRHDEHWLAGYIVEAPDARFVTIDVEDETWICSFHSPEGKSHSMMKVSLPKNDYIGAAYDGEHVLLAFKQAVIAIDRTGRPAWQASWPGGTAPNEIVGMLGRGRIVVRTKTGLSVLEVA